MEAVTMTMLMLMREMEAKQTCPRRLARENQDGGGPKVQPSRRFGPPQVTHCVTTGVSAQNAEYL